jgi:hypothetical protein
MVAVPVSAMPQDAVAAPAGEPSEGLDAKALYEQGRAAYRVAKYEEALAAWERSYEISSAPLLLYNIALAHNAIYEKTGELDSLLQASEVMKSFITVAEADPALQSELGDARQRREGFLERIREHEEKERAAAEAKAAEEAAGKRNAEARAKRMRLAGAITMGVGGGVFLTGASLGTLYLVRSKEFSNQVAKDRRAVELKLEEGPDDPDATTVNRCLENEENATAALDYANSMSNGDLERVEAGCRPAINELADLAQTRLNGKKANSLTIVGFAVIGGIGLAAVIAGAVVFAQGNRASRAAKAAARLQIVPQIGGLSRLGGPGAGPATNGFVVQGRF